MTFTVNNNPPEGAKINAENVKKVMQEKGVYITKNKGNSMYPMMLHQRGIAEIVPVTRPLKKYDIPLYMCDYKEDLVLHRILKVRENDYIIRGDNTFVYEYIPKENVVGVLRAFYKNGKRIDCATSKGFKIYSFFIIRVNFFRKVWVKGLRPFLSGIKHKILK